MSWTVYTFPRAEHQWRLRSAMEQERKREEARKLAAAIPQPLMQDTAANPIRSHFVRLRPSQPAPYSEDMSQIYQYPRAEAQRRLRHIRERESKLKMARKDAERAQNPQRDDAPEDQTSDKSSLAVFCAGVFKVFKKNK